MSITSSLTQPAASAQESSEPTRRDELKRLVSAHAALGRGVILHYELERLGCDQKDIGRLLREGVIRRMHRGAYEAPGSRDYAENRFARKVLAYVRATGPDRPPLAAAAALSWHGLPVIDPVPRKIHVIGRAPSGNSFLAGLDEVPDDQLISHRAVRSSSVARSIIDTARLISLSHAVAAADTAIRRGLLGADELELAPHDLHGYRGVVRARLCRTLVSGRAESPWESVSRVQMHLAGLPPPILQKEFRDQRGFIGRVDFWFADNNVIGEYDGRFKYGRDSPSQRPADEEVFLEKRREDRLRATGAVVARWTTSALRAPGRLAEILLRSFAHARHRRPIR